MNRIKLFNRQALLVVGIALINYAAIKFHWYSSLWWFDMPMHFLGGLWVGMLLIWYIVREDFSLHAIGRVLLGAFIVGMAWEVLELVLNEQFIRDTYDLRDTISDLFFDLSGTFAAMFYAMLRIMNIGQNKLQFYNAEKS
ncbi:MAG: hypothetical protein ACK4FA_02540 [Candidatus Paceibacteria bacterium]